MVDDDKWLMPNDCKSSHCPFKIRWAKTSIDEQLSTKNYIVNQRMSILNPAKKPGVIYGSPKRLANPAPRGEYK